MILLFSSCYFAKTTHFQRSICMTQKNQWVVYNIDDELLFFFSILLFMGL
jgi:hypothetical protein